VATSAADDDADHVAAAVAPSIVHLKVGDGTGSGVLFRDDGHVLTSADGGKGGGPGEREL